MRIYADREINDSNMVSGTGTLSPYIRNLEAVADAARAVRAGAVPRPEYAGLIKIVIHAQDWQALTDAFDKLDGKVE